MAATRSCQDNQASCQSGQYDGDCLDTSVDGYGAPHVGIDEIPVPLPDIWLMEILPEIVVRTAEAAIEDTRQGRLRITAVWTRMLRPVMHYK